MPEPAQIVEPFVERRSPRREKGCALSRQNLREIPRVAF
jgi:hypothetical protein